MSVNRLSTVKTQRERRSYRVRSRMSGTAERPRLHVRVTNQHVSAQLIDDEKHVTIAAASTVGRKDVAPTMTEKATVIGQEIAKAAKAKKVNKVVFDRGSKLYHGRVAALASAAREAGLEF